jgi:hypothetical protein
MNQWRIIILGSLACSLVAHFENRAGAQGTVASAVRIAANRPKGTSTATGIVLERGTNIYLVTAYHHILDSNFADIAVPSIDKTRSEDLIRISSPGLLAVRTVGADNPINATAYCDPDADIAVFKFSDDGKKTLTKLTPRIQPISLYTGILAPGTRLIAAGNLTLDFQGGLKAYVARNMSFGAMAALYDAITQILPGLPDGFESRLVLMVESLSIDKGFSGGPLVIADGPNADKLAGMVWGGSLSGNVKPGRFAWGATAQQIDDAVQQYETSADAGKFLVYGDQRPAVYPKSPYSGEALTSDVILANEVIDIRGDAFWEIDQPAVDEILVALPGVRYHFTNVLFQGIDFTKGRFLNARFHGCQFNNCNFAGASVNGCAFSNCFVGGRPMEVDGIRPLLCYGVVLQNAADPGYGGGLLDVQWDPSRLKYAAVTAFPSYLDVLLEPTNPRATSAKNIATTQRAALVSRELHQLKAIRANSTGRLYNTWSLQIALLSCDLALTHLLRGDQAAAEEYIRQTDLETAKIDGDNFVSEERRMLRQLEALRKLVLFEQTQISPSAPLACPTTICEPDGCPVILYQPTRCRLFGGKR